MTLSLSKFHAVLLALGLCGLASCSSVRYGDPTEEETVNIDYGITDRQRIVEEMVNSLVESPALSYFEHPSKGADKRVMIVMGTLENKTSEHIDTGGISDSIREELFKSGKFRFTAGDQGQAAIEKQVRFQQGSGRVSQESAKAYGKQIGADVILYGTLRSIEKNRGRSFESGGVKTERTDYQFVLQAENIETGEIIWIESKDLTKTAKTGLFGRT